MLTSIVTVYPIMQSYRPRLSTEKRPHVLKAAIRSIGVATIVTPTSQGILATQVPTLLREGPDGQMILATHVARANPHWRAADGLPSLAIFQGPHSYMSPERYSTKRETGKVVPTWLYVSVHAHGWLKVTQDKDWLLRQITELTDLHEFSRQEPWNVSDAPAGYIESMMRGIVGIEFHAERLEGAWKLNEEENQADLRGTYQSLQAEGPECRLLAKALEDRCPSISRKHST